MKNIFFLFLFVSVPQFAKGGNEGEHEIMEIIVKWENPRDTFFLKNLRRDEDICCSFRFVTIKSDEHLSEVKTQDGISLGTIYGKFDSGFLKKIAPRLESNAFDLRRVTNKLLDPRSLEINKYQIKSYE